MLLMYWWFIGILKSDEAWGDPDSHFMKVIKGEAHTEQGEKFCTDEDTRSQLLSTNEFVPWLLYVYQQTVNIEFAAFIVALAKGEHDEDTRDNYYMCDRIQIGVLAIYWFWCGWHLHNIFHFFMLCCLHFKCQAFGGGA